MGVMGYTFMIIYSQKYLFTIQLFFIFILADCMENTYECLLRV